MNDKTYILTIKFNKEVRNVLEVNEAEVLRSYMYAKEIAGDIKKVKVNVNSETIESMDLYFNNDYIYSYLLQNEVKPEKPVNYVIIGGLWWDKINGNTYNSAKVIANFKDGRSEKHYTKFCYGYGTHYIHEAKELIKEIYNDDDPKYTDAGSSYLKKTDVKNGRF